MAEVRDYRMALHIHTRYSDGSGFVREIVATGREAGLDVLVISDHNTLAAERRLGRLARKFSPARADAGAGKETEGERR